MHKIGICDDDEIFCADFEQQVIDYCKEIHLTIETTVFTTGEELLKYIAGTERLDLLFLDICLQKMTGYEIGNKLRNNPGYEAVQIVYVSIDSDYAMKLFESRPLNFLIKPIDSLQLHSVLDEYKRLFDRNKSFFLYHARKQEHHIDMSRILYLESTGRTVDIVTMHGKESYRGKLSETLSQLDTTTFCTVHKSYIVNLNYIDTYHFKDIVMVDGTTIPISQSRRIEIKQVMLDRNIKKRQATTPLRATGHESSSDAEQRGTDS